MLVYRLTGATWAETVVPVKGVSYIPAIALTPDASAIVVGAPGLSSGYPGGVGVYRWNGTAYAMTLVTAGINFPGFTFSRMGSSVATNADATMILAGAPLTDSKGAAFLLVWNGAAGKWNVTKWQPPVLSGNGYGSTGDNCGVGAAMARDGSTMVYGCWLSASGGNNRGKVFFVEGLPQPTAAPPPNPMPPPSP